MKELERQLATLLKDAPGEPPNTPDLATVSAARVSRRRWPAPLIAAAVVLAVVVPVVALRERPALTNAPASSPRTGSTSDQPAHPRRAAVRAAETIIAIAPAPPGATSLDAPPVTLNTPGSTPGAQYVERTRFWSASGTVAAAISYLTSHPPAGMRWSGSGGPGDPATPGTLEFAANAFRSVQYSVVAYHGGTAIRADAQVLWAPRRAAADMVPASLSSVDVVIVRQDPQRHQDARTVRRTLTGTAARALADFINQLPRAVPTEYPGCPPKLGGEQRTDQLVFHSAGPTVKVVVDLAGCASTTFQAGHRTPIHLSRTFVGVVSGIDHVIMTAVGLPANYGS
jgi:hypothetical protein